MTFASGYLPGSFDVTPADPIIPQEVSEARSPRDVALYIGWDRNLIASTRSRLHIRLPVLIGLYDMTVLTADDSIDAVVRGVSRPNGLRRSTDIDVAAAIYLPAQSRPSHQSHTGGRHDSTATNSVLLVDAFDL